MITLSAKREQPECGTQDSEDQLENPQQGSLDGKLGPESPNRVPRPLLAKALNHRRSSAETSAVPTSGPCLFDMAENDSSVSPERCRAEGPKLLSNGSRASLSHWYTDDALIPRMASSETWRDVPKLDLSGSGSSSSSKSQQSQIYLLPSNPRAMVPVRSRCRSLPASRSAFHNSYCKEDNLLEDDLSEESTELAHRGSAREFMQVHNMLRQECARLQRSQVVCMKTIQETALMVLEERQARQAETQERERLQEEMRRVCSSLHTLLQAQQNVGGGSAALLTSVSAAAALAAPQAHFYPEATAATSTAAATTTATTAAATATTAAAVTIAAASIDAARENNFGTNNNNNSSSSTASDSTCNDSSTHSSQLQQLQQQTSYDDGGVSSSSSNSNSNGVPLGTNSCSGNSETSAVHLRLLELEKEQQELKRHIAQLEDKKDSSSRSSVASRSGLTIPINTDSSQSKRSSQRRRSPTRNSDGRHRQSARIARGSAEPLLEDVVKATKKCLDAPVLKSKRRSITKKDVPEAPNSFI